MTGSRPLPAGGTASGRALRAGASSARCAAVSRAVRVKDAVISGTVSCKMPTVKAEGRVYGGRTGDERAARRREALLDAAFAEVAGRGWRGLAIDVICRRAGLNKRYFYESFAGIDALVAAVTARVADDAIAATLAVLDPDMPPAEYTRAGVGAFVAHLTDDPRRARVLFGVVGADDAASGHRAEAVRRIIATVASRGRDVHPIADPVRADLVAGFLVGGTSQAVLDWLDGRTPFTRAELVEELAALWTSLGETAVARDRTLRGRPAAQFR